jgi:hypothetical protein
MAWDFMSIIVRALTIPHEKQSPKQADRSGLNSVLIKSDFTDCSKNPTARRKKSSRPKRI